MQFKASKPFKYSHDGVTAIQANEGEIHDIPADLVMGLTSEGYGSPAAPAPAPAAQKDAGPAPENKATMAAPENKVLFAPKAAPPAPPVKKV